MTIDTSQRCGVCRCYMDNDDLFCANCGTENPGADSSAQQLAHTASHHSFDCSACGASMSYDASAQALRCPFCGSTQLQARTDVRSVVPDGVIPLHVTQEQALLILKRWLGSGFWRPSDAARASSVGNMLAVYVPFWVFEAEAHTKWTADTSPPPHGYRGEWYPISGTNRGQHSGILVGGSSVLTPNETDSISPFELRDVVPPDALDLENAIVEEFKVPRKLARPLARGAIEMLEAQSCRASIRDRSRNVRVNVQIAAMRGRPLLLPVWILAYRYRNNVYRVLVNGQTGKIAGSAPFSYGKLALAAILAAMVFTLFVLFVLLSAGR